MYPSFGILQLQFNTDVYYYVVVRKSEVGSTQYVQEMHTTRLDLIPHADSIIHGIIHSIIHSVIHSVIHSRVRGLRHSAIQVVSGGALLLLETD